MLLRLNILQQNAAHYHYIVTATLAMVIMGLAVKLAVKQEHIITAALAVVIMRLAVKIAIKHEHIIAATLAVVVMRLAVKIAVKHEHIIAATLAVVIVRLAVKIAVKHERVIAATLAVVVVRLAVKIAVKHEHIIAATLAVVVMRLAVKIAVKQRSAANADPTYCRQHERGNNCSSHQSTLTEDSLFCLRSSDGGVRKFAFGVGHDGKREKVQLQGQVIVVVEDYDMNVSGRYGRPTAMIGPRYCFQCIQYMTKVAVRTTFKF